MQNDAARIMMAVVLLILFYFACQWIGGQHG